MRTELCFSCWGEPSECVSVSRSLCPDTRECLFHWGGKRTTKPPQWELHERISGAGIRSAACLRPRDTSVHSQSAGPVASGSAASCPQRAGSSLSVGRGREESGGPKRPRPRWPSAPVPAGSLQGHRQHARHWCKTAGIQKLQYNMFIRTVCWTKEADVQRFGAFSAEENGSFVIWFIVIVRTRARILTWFGISSFITCQKRKLISKKPTAKIIHQPIGILFLVEPSL